MTPTERPIDLVLAFCSGGLLTLMVLFNGQMAAASGPLWSSLVAHGTGTVAALVIVAFLAKGVGAGPAPRWAYLGGVSGALTVMLTSLTVNSVLALSGTLALGLLGQVAFSLATDRFGLFGLPRRAIPLRVLAGAALILAGSGVIILGSGR